MRVDEQMRMFADMIRGAGANPKLKVQMTYDERDFAYAVYEALRERWNEQPNVPTVTVSILRQVRGHGALCWTVQLAPKWKHA